MTCDKCYKHFPNSLDLELHRLNHQKINTSSGSSGKQVKFETPKKEVTEQSHTGNKDGTTDRSEHNLDSSMNSLNSSQERADDCET